MIPHVVLCLAYQRYVLLLVNATALGLAYPAARSIGHVVILQYLICI